MAEVSAVDAPPGVHPVLAALRAAHAALDAVVSRDAGGRASGWVGLGDAAVWELREVVELQAGLEGRVAGLRLHTAAAAQAAQAGAGEAAADTSAWLASVGRNRCRSLGAVWLADLLDRKYAATRSALAAGRISEEHAEVIVRAGEKVPDGVDPVELAECEERLVGKAEAMSPQRLRRAARRMLEPLSPVLADLHQEELLVEEERRAEREAWLVLGDNGDGTWTGKFTVPELHGQLLRHALDRLSGPRRYGRGRAGQLVLDPTVPGAGTQLNASEAAGAAFCELVEHLPDAGHTRSGIALVVHVAEETLRSGTGAATLSSGAEISIEQARRLACEAGILPMVLRGGSVPLDLGTSTRLFTRAQAVALSSVHESCAAAGCDRPFAWCELHHKVPWGAGGPTDLANAAPLCGFHHRRVHDQHYDHRWEPDGTVTFRHRWASRHHGTHDRPPPARAPATDAA